MKPKLPPGSETPRNASLQFCTECGATLDEFCFSPNADDIKAIRENFARCKHSGKFQGEMCAKLFIANSRLPETSPDDLPDSAG